MKVGIVDVGGGYRGIYAAGVLDYCLDQDIRFDLAIGVSAGSANLISYAAGQARRNLKFYTEYGLRTEYASAKNFVTKGSFVDLDYEAFAANPMEFYVVATEAKTGKVRYFDKSDISQDNYDALKASSTLPFVNKPYRVGCWDYYDGALGDPVPVEKAFSLGCDKVVLLLTKPEGVLRDSKKDDKIAKLIQRKYPWAAGLLEQRAFRYNDSVAKAQALAKEGKVLIVAPDDTCGVDTLTRDKAPMLKLYKKGYGDGQKIKAFLSGED